MAQDPVQGAILGPFVTEACRRLGILRSSAVAKAPYGIYQELSILRVLPLDPPTPAALQDLLPQTACLFPEPKSPPRPAKLEFSTTGVTCILGLFTPDPLAGRDGALTGLFV